MVGSEIPPVLITQVLQPRLQQPAAGGACTLRFQQSTHVHTRTCAHVHARTHACAQTCAHRRRHQHTSTHTQTQTHSPHTESHGHTHTHNHTHIITHPHTHKITQAPRTHKHTRTHTHTHDTHTRATLLRSFKPATWRTCLAMALLRLALQPAPVASNIEL